MSETTAAMNVSSGGLATWIIGAIAGGVALLLIIIVVVVCVVMRKRSNESRADDLTPHDTGSLRDKSSLYKEGEYFSEHTAPARSNEYASTKLVMQGEYGTPTTELAAILPSATSAADNYAPTSAIKKEVIYETAMPSSEYAKGF